MRFARVCTVYSWLILLVAGCHAHHPPGQATTMRVAASSTTQNASQQVALREMTESLTYLSSDELEGRGLDTNGLNLAAAFISGNFHASGLLPLPGMNDYFQRFDRTTVESVGAETTLSIGGKPLTVGEDYRPLGFSAEKAFDAPAVFVGYGITSAEYHYDDYANIDVKGKVAVAWRMEPANGDRKSRFTQGDWSDQAHLDTKCKNAAAHGAVALILANPPEFGSPDLLLPLAHSFQESTASIPVIHVKHKIVDGWLKSATGEEAKAIEAKIDSGPKPQSKQLDFSITGKVAMKRSTRTLRNIAGYLPGVGPHADEFVIVGAHYDHLGRGGPGSLAMNSHEIHHGADDNGSGTTTVIELAREFGDEYAHGKRWPRSIIFMTFTAEEEGLIGSAHFVEHSPIPLKQVAAMLNLDMVGRLRNQELFTGGTGTAPSLEAIVNQADRGLPLKLTDSGKGGLGPSDHMSFAQKKVPVVFLWTGLHADYHRPTDTVEKINFVGMVEILDLSQRIVTAMTEMPKEQYVTAADAHSMSMGFGSGPGMGNERRATLGVIPSYGEEEGKIKGVKISGATDGSPAAKAGLKENDILTNWNGKTLDSLMDLSTDLSEAKPGDRVKLKLMRDGKEIEVEATLAERK